MNIIELGERVKAKRKRERLTIEQASAQSGVHDHTIWRVEHGRGSSITGENFNRLLLWLGDVPDGAVVVRITRPLPELVNNILVRDTNLTGDSAARLTAMFRQAYEAVTGIAA